MSPSLNSRSSSANLSLTSAGSMETSTIGGEEEPIIPTPAVVESLAVDVDVGDRTMGGGDDADDDSRNEGDSDDLTAAGPDAAAMTTDSLCSENTQTVEETLRDSTDGLLTTDCLPPATAVCLCVCSLSVPCFCFFSSLFSVRVSFSSEFYAAAAAKPPFLLLFAAAVLNM